MKRVGKIIKYVLVVAVILFAVDVATIAWFASHRPAVDKADAVIVLGAAINTPALYNRTLEGLRFYKEGKVSMLVLSGGRISDKDISEAAYMRKVILKNASSTIPVLLDEQSHNTYENIQNSKKLVPDAKSVVVVSDEFHLARAVLLAKRAGFEKVYWSAPKPYYYSKTDLAYYYLRESMAMIDYVPKFLFK